MKIQKVSFADYNVILFYYQQAPTSVLCCLSKASHPSLVEWIQISIIRDMEKSFHCNFHSYTVELTCLYIYSWAVWLEESHRESTKPSTGMLTSNILSTSGASEPEDGNLPKGKIVHWLICRLYLGKQSDGCWSKSVWSSPFFFLSLG